MKKPIIKNWIKYGAGTLAIAGTLVMGGCGNEETTTETELVETEEVVMPEREEVSMVIEEEEEVVVAEEAEVTETEETAIRKPQFAYTIRNMDAHLDKFEEVNQAIKEELTDADNIVSVDID